MLFRSRIVPLCSRIKLIVRGLHKSDDRKLHNVKNHVVDKTPITAQLWQMRQKDNQFDEMLASAPQKIVPKTTGESKLSLCYNFTKDSHRETYTSTILATFSSVNCWRTSTHWQETLRIDTVVTTIPCPKDYLWLQHLWTRLCKGELFPLTTT